MLRTISAFVTATLLTLLASGPAWADMAYSYDAAKSGPVTYGAPRTLAPGIASRSFEFVSASGKKVIGEIIAGSATTPQPGLLFVHWLGEPATTNHREFEHDAQALAARGATSVLIDTIWAAADWFKHMGASVEADSLETIDQVVDMRTAIDLLIVQKNVDPARIAFVGHDFGAMLGALMASVETRPQYWVYLAGNPVLSSWYTLGKKSATHDQYVAAMARFDVLAALRASKPKGVLLQFSAHDEYVTPGEALTFFNAAPLPRGAFFYDADHGLATPQVFRDRQAWLTEQLFGEAKR